MPNPHTHEQTQNPGQTQGWEQEPAWSAASAPSAVATSVVHGTGPGLVATDGFHPVPTDDGHQVLVWDTPTPQERQLIAAARHGEPLPGAQTRVTTPPPVLPHDEAEPVQVVYHSGRPGSEASTHPAEFARQLSRQYEALSYLTVDEYLEGRNLYHTHKRAPAPTSLELQRADLEGQIVARLVREYRFDRSDAKEKAAEAVQALVALHEPDQSLRGTHQLAAGEIVWGNAPVNSSIGSQHKAGLARLDQAAHAARKAGRGHHYLNVRVVLCDSPRLASHIRRGTTAVIVGPAVRREQVSYYTRADPGALAWEIGNKYPHLSHSPPQPATTPTDETSRINHVKSMLAAAFPDPATPTKPHNPPTRPHDQSTRNRTRNHPQNQIER